MLAEFTMITIGNSDYKLPQAFISSEQAVKSGLLSTCINMTSNQIQSILRVCIQELQGWFNNPQVKQLENKL